MKGFTKEKKPPTGNMSSQASKGMLKTTSKIVLGNKIPKLIGGLTNSPKPPEIRSHRESKDRERILEKEKPKSLSKKGKDQDKPKSNNNTNQSTPHGTSHNIPAALNNTSNNIFNNNISFNKINSNTSDSQSNTVQNKQINPTSPNAINKSHANNNFHAYTQFNFHNQNNNLNVNHSKIENNTIIQNNNENQENTTSPDNLQNVCYKNDNKALNNSVYLLNNNNLNNTLIIQTEKKRRPSMTPGRTKKEDKLETVPRRPRASNSSKSVVSSLDKEGFKENMRSNLASNTQGQYYNLSNTVKLDPTSINLKQTQNYNKRNPSICPETATSNNTAQIRVVSRFRPLNSVEMELSQKNLGSLCSRFESHDTVSITSNLSVPQSFTLDRIFDPSTTQKDLYEQVAKPTIEDVLKGYNGTIFTYGQSGSGKTFCMYGIDLYDEDTKGIIPRSIEAIFDFINDEANNEIKFELKFSMLEIYKENLHDLLSPATKPSELKIKEHPQKGIYVMNLSEEYINNEEEFLLMIENAEEYRVVSETGLNKVSSRSHLLFQLEILQKFPDDTERRGMLNLVDLAGSEKITKTHAVGETLEEAKKINLSLSTLGNVIKSLTSSKNEFVPYRDSKLTRILQDSLGGNYKTTLLVTCSPHVYNCEETISTLKFAQRAKKIKNSVKINLKRSTEQLEAIIQELTRQLGLANDEILRFKNIFGVNGNLGNTLTNNNFSGNNFGININTSPNCNIEINTTSTFNSIPALGGINSNKNGSININLNNPIINNNFTKNEDDTNTDTDITTNVRMSNNNIVSTFKRQSSLNILNNENNPLNNNLPDHINSIPVFNTKEGIIDSVSKLIIPTPSNNPSNSASNTASNLPSNLHSNNPSNLPAVLPINDKKNSESSVNHFNINQINHINSINNVDISRYLDIIKRKDEDIINLNEKIDSLQEENKSLQEKIDKMSRETGYVHFYQILENLQKMTKKNLEDIKSVKFERDIEILENLKKENENLKESYNSLESKYVKTLKELEAKFSNFNSYVVKEKEKEEIVPNSQNHPYGNKLETEKSNLNSSFNSSEISINYEEEISKYQLNFHKFFNNNDSIISAKNLHSKSYKNIYNFNKMYVNTLLKDFLKKKEMFGSKFNSEIYFKNFKDSSSKYMSTNLFKNNENSKKNMSENYNELRVSFMKMNFLIIYYEKIIFDLMNRVLVDVKKFEVENKNKEDAQKKFEGFNKTLILYLEILEELKEIKKLKEYENTENPCTKKNSYLKPNVEEILENENEESHNTNTTNKELPFVVKMMNKAIEEKSDNKNCKFPLEELTKSNNEQNKKAYNDYKSIDTKKEVFRNAGEVDLDIDAEAGLPIDKEIEFKTIEGIALQSDNYEKEDRSGKNKGKGKGSILKNGKGKEITTHEANTDGNGIMPTTPTNTTTNNKNNSLGINNKLKVFIKNSKSKTIINTKNINKAETQVTENKEVSFKNVININNNYDVSPKDTSKIINPNEDIIVNDNDSHIDDSNRNLPKVNLLDDFNAEGSNNNPNANENYTSINDIEEKKRTRLTNNLKFLKSMNFLKQETPVDRSEPNRHSEDTPSSIVTFNNMVTNGTDGSNPNNNNYIPTNPLNTAETLITSIIPPIVSPAQKIDFTKMHSNNNIIMPVAKKKPSRLMNNLGLLFSKLVQIDGLNGLPGQYSTGNNQVNNFSSTFAVNAMNNGSGINGMGNAHHASVVDTRETPPLTLREEEISENVKSHNKMIFKKRTMNCRVPKMYDWLRDSIVSNNKLTNLNQMGNMVLNNPNNNEEIRQLRKELDLYKTTVQNLSSELEFLRNHNINIEKIISEYQENQKKILDSEIENLSHVIKIYKSFYEDELIKSRQVIEELAKIIDEIYLNNGIKEDSLKDINTMYNNAMNISNTEGNIIMNTENCQNISSRIVITNNTYNSHNTGFFPVAGYKRSNTVEFPSDSRFENLESSSNLNAFSQDFNYVPNNTLSGNGFRTGNYNNVFVNNTLANKFAHTNTFRTCNTDIKCHSYRNRPVLNDYLEYKKEKILNDMDSIRNSNISMTPNIMRVAEALVEDGGTATKKLDYVLFKVENNYDQVKIQYGSGLNGTFPCKSPLCRNLKFNLLGDTHSDVESPQSTD